MRYFNLLILLFTFSLQVAIAQENSQSPYLGQTPTGQVAKAFAPGIVCTDYYEYSGVFTSDMKEFYFLRNGGKYEAQTFVVSEYKDGQWVESVVSPRVGQPIFSPDGKTMHLGKRYKERTATGWSDVKSLEEPFKDIAIMRLSASANGTYYFDTFDRENLSFPLRYSRVVDGKHEEPQVLSKAINTGTYLSHPFIAPDESYLLWDAKREDGFGDSDIYISFRQADGSWGDGINLGENINTEAWEAAATVTPDGKYIFFNRNIGSDQYDNVDIYWVDAQVIERLRNR